MILRFLPGRISSVTNGRFVAAKCFLMTAAVWYKVSHLG